MVHFKSIAFALAAVLVACTSAQARVLDKVLPFLSNSEIDIQHYTVAAQVAQMPPTQVDFETKIDLVTLIPTTSIELHIESGVMTVQGITFEGAAVAFNILPGIPNTYGLSGSVLEVVLPRTTQPGERLSLDLSYVVGKKDWASDDLGLFYVPADKNFGQDILITRNWPYYGRFWLPSNDSPDDVASIEYKISVPDGYKVAAGGKLVAGDESLGSGLLANGLRLFEWSQKTPTTVYNFAFAVGKFDVSKKEICYFRDGKVNDTAVPCRFATNKIPAVLYYNKNNPNAATLLAQIEKAHSSAIYFSKLFGPYAFDKIGFVASPYPFAMESTSMIVLNAPSSAVHEVVHHWWGNNVHFEHWGDFWISEGFTTFFTGIFDEYKSSTFTACLKNPTEALNHGADTDPNSIFNDTPYCKGAFALHNLRTRMVNLGGISPAATRAFFGLMKRMYVAHSTQRLSTKAVVAFVENNMVDAMKEKGITITQAQATQLVTRWKAMWFTGL